MEERLKAIKYEVLTDYIDSMADCIGSQGATEFEQGFDKACEVIASFAKTLEVMQLYVQHKEGILNDFRM